MHNPLHITLHDLNHNEDIKTVIQEKFTKITEAGLAVTKCHVVLEKLSKHHQKANMVSVRLDLKVAHFEDIVVTERCPEDPAALKSAVLKVFKQGLDLAHQEKKRRRSQDRRPLRDLVTADPEEPEDE